MTDARVTQAPIEVAYKAKYARVRLTQFDVEVAFRGQRDIRLSQLVVEVAYKGSGTPEPPVTDSGDSLQCGPDRPATTEVKPKSITGNQLKSISPIARSSRPKSPDSSRSY